MQSEIASATKRAQPTILLAGTESNGSDFAGELASVDARVLLLPKIELGPPRDPHHLDEAIANLFGYDWIIFRTVPAVDHFLKRFLELRHEIADLDSLRLCAVGPATLHRLEAEHVHVDLSVEYTRKEIPLEFEKFLGGSGALDGLNFLVPTSASFQLSPGNSELSPQVDHVGAFEMREDIGASRIHALLVGGAIDAVLLADADGVRSFSDFVVATNSAEAAAGVPVFCFDEAINKVAANYGLRAAIARKDELSELLSKRSGNISAAD